MIEETAFVVRVDCDFAWVETKRNNTCGQCSAKKGCGTGLLSGVFEKKMKAIKVLNDAHAQKGDWVIIGLSESSLVKSAFMSYLLPLIFMFVGAILVQLVFKVQNEAGAIFGAFAGLAVSLWLLRKFSKHISRDPVYQAVILRKADFVSQFSNSH